MRRVILESPYAGRSRWRLVAFFQRMANRRYARRCVRDSLRRGEAPIASHLLYTQRGILRDGVQRERRWGIDAGLAWLEVAEATVVYVDRGISSGMTHGVNAARLCRLPIEFRELRPGRLARAKRFADRLVRGEGGDLRVDSSTDRMANKINTGAPWPVDLQVDKFVPTHSGEALLPVRERGRRCDCVRGLGNCHCV